MSDRPQLTLKHVSDAYLDGIYQAMRVSPDPALLKRLNRLIAQWKPKGKR